MVRAVGVMRVVFGWWGWWGGGVVERVGGGVMLLET